MADWNAVAGAAVLAAAGLAALYLRLRSQFDRGLTLLTLVLIAGASPLSQTVMQGELRVAAAFALTAAAVHSVTFIARVAWRIAVLVFVILVGAFLGPPEPSAPTLFSSNNGFLALAPVMYVAACATLLRVRAHPAEAIATLGALTLWPFAQTSLVPATAVLTPGLCAATAWAKRHPLLVVTPFVAVAIAWNYWLMVQYTIGTIPKDAPFSFAAMVRQQADVSTRSPFIYPFAFPGNLLSAWREGIPIGRYDELSAEPRGSAFEITFDRSADRFLLDGWSNAALSATGPFRTVASDRAALVFPLEPRAQSFDLAIAATVRGDATPPVEGSVQINSVDIGRFSASGPRPTEIRFTIRDSDVGRVLRAGYNRLSIVSSAPRVLAIHRVRIAPAS